MESLPIHVLLIEDNEEHITFLRQLLASSAAGQFELHIAGDVSHGIERLQDAGIQLILLDLSLPDSDGLETFIRVIEAAPDIPLIVLSGLSDVALAIETVQLGAQDYLVKGRVDNHLLVRSMQYAIERKRVQLQLKRANDSLEARVRERTEALIQTNTKLQEEIAERRRAEEALLDSNRQLSAALGQLQATQSEIIQRERMHALGRMANGIAHDFNNALAPILGFSELLLMKPETVQDPKKVRNYVELIYAAAKDSAKVVSRLREFYRYRDEGEVFTPVVINDVVLQAISITQRAGKTRRSPKA
ncbi:MAG: response regulator [Chthoniobacter sp.]